MSICERHPQVLFRRLSAAYLFEIWNDMAEIGLFLHRAGALLDRLVREPSEMVRKTSVQMMVAEWR